MAQGGFDMRRMSMGTKSALIIGGIALISLFLPWFTVAGGFGSLSGFSGIGVLAGILVIGLVVWEGLNAAGTLANVNAPKKLVTASLAAGAALFMIIRFLLKPGTGGFDLGIGWGIGAFIGLIAALGLAYAAYLNWQEHKTGAGAGPAAPPPPPAV